MRAVTGHDGREAGRTHLAAPAGSVRPAGLLLVGFTGTRRGMLAPQVDAVVAVLRRLQPDEFHHGLCQGADAQAHRLCRRYAPRARIVGHPPLDPSDLARELLTDVDVLLDPLPYLQRDRVIAATCDPVVATPAHPREVRRSGTWATVRYARERRHRAIVVRPDGTFA